VDSPDIRSYRRPRSFVRVSGPDAADFLERMVSNEVAPLAPGESREALLLTPKAREIEPEQHTSTVVLGEGEGIPTADYGVPAREVLDADADGDVEELEHLRIEARTPRFGREIDERVLPAEAGLVERAVSFTKGCYPGQEPIARLRYRGQANRRLAVLELEDGHAPAAETELRLDEKVVGRITSSVRGLALGYVRKEVEDGVALDVEGRHAKVRPARFELATSASAGQRSIP
jgi:tRNA-modifying protein YgfZ